MIKVLSLFSGIGAFEKALSNQNIPFELVGFSEIDKYAAKSYCAIHGVSEEMNLGDITKIDEKQLPKDIDLITYGFPCQDISLSGKQKGLFNEDGSLTRSGLFFDASRIIEHCQPKIAIAENVKNLTSKKFNAQFQIVLESLEQAGYNNYWKVLNSKDFGIPQNRERVFIVSIRKDIDTGVFQFPEGFPLELRLKDMLEDVVDEKYYISTANVDKLLKQHGDISGNSIIGGMQKNQSVKTDGIVTTLTSSMGTGGGYIPMVTEPVRIGNIYGEQFGTGYAGNVWDKAAISPTLMTMQGGNRQPMVLVEEATKNCNSKKDNFWISEKGVKYILSAKRGMCTDVNVDVIQPLTAKGQSNWTGSFVSPDIESLEKNTTIGGTEPVKIKLKSGEIITSNDDLSHLRIRKLTPKECFRLMGFDDEDFYKAAAVNSDAQLYKEAGNSIVVNVIEELVCKLEENQKWLRSEAKPKRSLIRLFELSMRLFGESETKEK